MTEQEQNEIRYKYFKMIIEAHRTGETDPMLPYTAEECIKEEAGKKVISFMGHPNTDIRHESTIVRLGPGGRGVSGTDENGRPVRFSLWYEPGEICMLDVRYFGCISDTYLYRLVLNEEGKVTEYYATCPALFVFHAVE